MQKIPKSLSTLVLLSSSLLLPTSITGEETKNVSSVTTVVGKPVTPPSLPSTLFEPFAGKVIKNKVRLRSLPNRDSAVIKEVNTGDLLVITGEENEFYVVQPPRSVKGYVFRTFVLDNIVEGEKVNIRLHPDIEAPVIGRLKNGDKVLGSVSADNAKWLEITIPTSVRFFVAKEFITKEGTIDLVAKVESRCEEALHKLNALFHFARAEVQKPFEEISFDGLNAKFESLIQEYRDVQDICEKAHEANALIEETYLQKKIAFLESKTEKFVAANDRNNDQLQKLTQLEQDLKKQMHAPASAAVLGEAAAAVLGKGTVASDVMSEKNLQWHSLEESLYHLWATTHEGQTIEEFYKEAFQDALFITGVVESYSRPVKNRPGDYLLRNEAEQPIAFLYSTKVNLQEAVGKRVTLVTTSRPNNNFAFPAYFVLAVE